jgi:AbrB family looped-hinge helix DNA binding protein
MPASTLTSKGQITIPREIRERLHLRVGSRIDFIVEPSGQVVLKPLDSNFRSIRGIVLSRRKRPVSIREMNEATAQGYSSK